ncbi:hypothetical protein PTKIN_Ptkin12aG0103600 [Pterospermum kingtungense]
MGGLRLEIADGIRMFKLKTLKKAISLARMKDEQLNRQKKASPTSNQFSNESTTQANYETTSQPKRLSWNEMQTRRVQGLCFNCNEKFTPTHKCKRCQVLILKAKVDVHELDKFESMEHKSWGQGSRKNEGYC